MVRDGRDGGGSTRVGSGVARAPTAGRGEPVEVRGAGTGPDGERAGTGPDGERAGTDPDGERAGTDPDGERAGTGPDGERAGTGPETRRGDGAGLTVVWSSRCELRSAPLRCPARRPSIPGR